MSIKVFCQKDPKWKDQLVGFATKSTMEYYGCLVACLSIIADYHSKDTNPELLNEALRRVDGFVAGTGYYYWKSLTKIYSDISYTKMVDTPNPVSSAQFNEIDAHLEKGLLVLAHVDNKTPDGHFVLIVKKSHGGYDIADPWIGEVTRLSTYGTASITVQRYFLYQGPIEIHEEPPLPDVADQKVSVDLATETGIIHFDEFSPTWTYRHLAYGFKEYVEKYNKIKGTPKELADCKKQWEATIVAMKEIEDNLEKAQDKIATLTGENELFASTIQTLTQELIDARECINILEQKFEITDGDFIRWLVSKILRKKYRG